MPYLKKSLRLWSVWGLPRCLYSLDCLEGVFSETHIQPLGCLCVRTGAKGRFLARGEILTKQLALDKPNRESRGADSNR